MVAINWKARMGNAPLARAKLIFSNSNIAAIRNLSVEEHSLGLVLRGKVPLYFYKQMAQELLRNEIEDMTLFNEIEVVDHR
jgi:hypothetical protein